MLRAGGWETINDTRRSKKQAACAKVVDPQSCNAVRKGPAPLKLSRGLGAGAVSQADAFFFTPQLEGHVARHALRDDRAGQWVLADKPSHVKRPAVRGI